MKLVHKLFLLSAMVGVAESSAARISYQVHGNSCVSATAGLSAQNTQFGIYNPSNATTMVVSCPITVPRMAYTEGFLGISAYSRHNTNMVSCTLGATTDDGNNLATGTAKVTMNSPNLQYATARLYPPGTEPSFYLNCRIPPYTASGYSYLTTAYFNLYY